MKRDGVDYYYLTDAMGSVYQVVDENGNVANAYDYNAWGEIRETQTTETVANPFLWQTKPWDEEIGLYYSRLRYYQPTCGRCLSKDPLMEDNAYVFVRNLPAIATDPGGGCCRGLNWYYWNWTLGSPHVGRRESY